MVRVRGLEPPRPKSAGPQPTASTIPPYTHCIKSEIISI